jgi:hypothetical protein
VYEDEPSSPLVWITRRYAVNPANIVGLFHGSDGQIQIRFVSGDPMETNDRDLTLEGQVLLLQKEPARHQPRS